jgi:hypothetical protein
MAISQPTRSAQYTDLNPYTPRIPALTGNPLYELDAVLTFTVAGFTSAAAGDISLLRLPPGNLRIRNDLSVIICPVGTATSDFDMGVAAYTKDDGSAQSAQHIALADSLDVGGAALNQHLPLPAAGAGLIVNSRDGAVVVCSFDTADSPAAGTLYLKLVYQKEG